MPTMSDKKKASVQYNAATMIVRLRQRLRLSQTAFGHEVNSSAMGVSRWERGAQEPSSQSYIELGILAGDPDCWFFWARAGLRREDLMRVLPKPRNGRGRIRTQDLEILHDGARSKKDEDIQLMALPLLTIVAASNGQKGELSDILHDAPVESYLAAPRSCCPNPESTFCLRVLGESMTPLISSDYILVVDSSQTDRSKLNGKIVLAWNKDLGLTLSRFRRYDRTAVLHPDNRDFQSITIDRANPWKVIARVLWWIGKAP